MSSVVHTIGHSNHESPVFVGLLQQHGIALVADVRSQPYSRFNPQFNRETLQAALQVAGLQYLFLGAELGARSNDRACYVNGQARYELLATTALFKHGITRVVAEAQVRRVALMCAEKDPLTCHRAILVARALVTAGIDVQHILEDGRLESHGEALARLRREVKLPERDLFRGDAELEAEAYRLRGDEIAYVETAPAGDPNMHGAFR